MLTGVIFLFYGMVMFGSLVKLWGANHSLTFDNYKHVFTVGWGFIKDTLLLSSIATPIAGILAMIIAFLVVRKNFPGQEADGTGIPADVCRSREPSWESGISWPSTNIPSS